MPSNLTDMLARAAEALRLETDVLGPVTPGDRVSARVLPPADELAPTDTTLGDVDLQGATTVIDQLTGTVPVGARLPLSIEVSWSVVVGGFTLDSETDFVADDGLSAPRLDFVLAPIFPTAEFPARPTLVTELQDDRFPEPLAAEIRAVVTLALAGESVTRTLIQDFQALPLEIPTLLALFRHTNFEGGNDEEDGFALVVVPESSPLKTSFEAVTRVVDRLEETLAPARTTLGLAGFLTGLSILRDAASAQAVVRMRALDEIRNLDNIHMFKESFLGVDILNRDTRAEDRISSLVFIGPPNRAVELFNARNFDDDEGHLIVRAGDGMAAIVRRLHVGDPVSVVGDDLVEVRVRDDDGNAFGDSMSSLRFIRIERDDPQIPVVEHALAVG